MNHAAPPHPALISLRVLLVCALALSSPCAEVPRLPFSGALSSTVGAGSATGWDRHGGENPAVIAAPGFGVSIAGYRPFGLDGLQVVELAAVRDARRWGTSIGYRGLFDEAGGGAAEARMQFAVRPSARITLGAGASVHAGSGETGTGMTSGILWRPHAALGIGVFRETLFGSSGSGARTGFGIDAGKRLAAGPVWRVAAETHWRDDGLREDRFGAGVRLHPLLSVYAGFAPSHRSVGVGVRFGMGDWEGYSALRRHAMLGGTSIQGIRWRKDLE